jgi:hypothetical protein
MMPAVIVETRQDTVIQHGVLKVRVQGGAICLVNGADNVLKVRNLWEAKGGSLEVYVGNRLIASSAGQEIILTRDDSSRRWALSQDNVGRRRTKSFDLADGQTITSSEVSLVSLAVDSQLVYLLLRSDRPDERALASKLVKMAACLAHAHSHHGPFASAAHARASMRPAE